jgi:hypothetical protein
MDEDEPAREAGHNTSESYSTKVTRKFEMH